jgi:O-antigen/teichoic acid export membrane protein
MSPSLRQFTRKDSAVQLVAANLVAAGLAVLSAPIIARSLGPDGRGETAAALTLTFLAATVLAVGLPLEVSRLAARGSAAPALRTVRLLMFGAFVPAGVLAAGAYWTIFASFDSGSRAMATASIVLSPLTISWMCDASVLSGRQRFRALFVMRVTYPATFLVSVAALWISGHASAATVIGSSIGTSAVTAVLGWALTGASLRGPRLPVMEVVRPALRVSGGTIADAALSRLDQVLIVPLMGAYDAGLYSVATAFGIAPLAVGQALGAAYFRDIAKAEGPDRQVLKAEAARAGLAVAALLTPPLMIAAYVLVPVIFGHEFDDSALPAAIYLLGGAAWLASVPCMMALVADQRGHAVTVAQLAGLAVNIALLVGFSQFYGVTSAAIAAAAGFTTVIAIYLWMLRLPIRQIVPRRSDAVAGFRRLVHTH